MHVHTEGKAITFSTNLLSFFVILQIAKRDYTLFTKLVRDLTVHCETDLEKAR